MEWIKNLKIAQKLNVLLALTVSVGLVIGLVGYFYVQKGCNDMTEIYTKTVKPSEYIAGFGFNMINAYADTYKYITDPSQRSQLNVRFAEYVEENNTYMAEYEKSDLSSEEKNEFNKLKESIEAYRPVRAKARALADAGKTAAALAVMRQNEATLQTTLSSLYKMKELAANKATEINTQNDKDTATAKIFLLVSIIGGLGVLISLGLMIANMITRPIKQAIDGLNIGTEEVSSASSQVAAASQALAEGTSEQAASVQETSSTLEETSSMVHQNRENTQQAATLAKQANQFAQKSSEEMGRMMASMTELKSSSNEIAKIIKVIDEIAFQTNILSLNAAVEAARAGDAGKGFAVVAEEVRNLAQRSAQAAKDTAVIIESNISLSDSGVDIAKAVRESVGAIEEQAGKVSDLLEEISVATNEQAQGVEQINKAVSQMEVVLHTNAQTAEEAASASQALSEQAINVKEIVNTLMVLVEGADALRGQSHRMALSANPQRRIGGVATQSRIATKSTVKPGRSPENIIPLNDF